MSYQPRQLQCRYILNCLHLYRRDSRLNGRNPTTTAHPERGAPTPVHPPPGYRTLDFTGVDAPRLTHYLFRFPAKFHPPVVHSLIREYTTPGQTLLDPFCGSGTLLLASAAEGRHATGSDIDPVAVFISAIKTHRFPPGHLETSWSVLRPHLMTIARSADEYDSRRFVDITEDEYENYSSQRSSSGRRLFPISCIGFGDI